jgi:hypothetical protein
VKALTICQPYAELIARGEKPIENRSWPTSFRGRIAIHAGKSKAWMDPDDGQRYPGLAFGAIVATAELYDCVLLERLPADLRNHEHANGPWCWLLRDVRRIEPIAMNGALGLWDLTSEFEGRVLAATGDL